MSLSALMKVAMLNGLMHSVKKLDVLPKVKTKDLQRHSIKTGSSSILKFVQDANMQFTLIKVWEFLRLFVPTESANLEFFVFYVLINGTVNLQTIVETLIAVLPRQFGKM